jgi:hypothetical protein
MIKTIQVITPNVPIKPNNVNATSINLKSCILYLYCAQKSTAYSLNKNIMLIQAIYSLHAGAGTYCSKIYYQR